MAKMWTGVTDGVTDSIADDFNSSIHLIYAASLSADFTICSSSKKAFSI